MRIANLLRVIANVMDAPHFDQDDPERCIIGVNRKLVRSQYPDMSYCEAFAEYVGLTGLQARIIWLHAPENTTRGDAIRMLLRLGETGEVQW